MRDPEIRYIANGSAVTKFTFAINNTRTKSSEDTQYVDITAWGKLGGRQARSRRRRQLVRAERTIKRVIAKNATVADHLAQRAFGDRPGVTNIEVSFCEII